MQERSHKQQK
jgi:hypothetical protein